MRWLRRWLTRQLIDRSELHLMVWQEMHLFYKSANERNWEPISKQIADELMKSIEMVYFDILEK